MTTTASNDAVKVAPDVYTVLFENERVRVLHTFIPGGALPTQRCPAYSLAWSRFVRRDHHGNLRIDLRQSNDPLELPAVRWLDRLARLTVENASRRSAFSSAREADRRSPSTCGG